MEERKRALKILTYDDVLSRLRETLFDEQRGPAACARLRERYDVVLVDEFQDTDPVQWDIMHRAFGEGGATLVLIGDPKQAIYAFRGADVHAYLQARDVVQSEWTLDVNWRSDQGLLEAYDALFADAQLGYAGITYRNDQGGRRQPATAAGRGPVDVPLRVRIVHADDGLVPLTAQRQQPKAPGREELHRAGPGGRGRRSCCPTPRSSSPAAGTGVELGAHDAAPRPHRRAGADEQPCRDRPRRAARRRRPGRDRRFRLRLRHRAGAGVAPAARGARAAHGAGPRVAGRADLLRGLDARRGGHRGRSASGRACTGRCTAGRRLLRDQGIASLYQTVSSSHEVPERVLARPSGERFMTDLRHIAQLLHEAGVSEGLGPTAMATWLGRRIHDAARDGENEERARRLESDAEAVQVITIHRSKGLEFPIVFCPYMWDGRPFSKDDVPMFHDPDNANLRTIDVGREGNAFAVHQKMELEEGRGEDLRLSTWP